MGEFVAILDCGGQYTKVIDRKVREMGVKSDIYPINVEYDKLKGYNGVILSGGPSSVWEDGSPVFDEKILELGVPVLGICYGMQLVNKHFGGEVNRKKKSEYGVLDVSIDNTCPLFAGLDKVQKMLMSHGDSIIKVANGFKICAETPDAVAAIYNEEKRIYAVQFHPEVELTENGLAILNNFLRGICGLKEKYGLDDRIQSSVDMIKSRVGNNKVIVLVSGGVDSAVTAALLLKALPAENIFGIHVDHGLMRKNESDIICENLKSLGLLNLKRINGEEIFFNTPIDIGGGQVRILSQETDPEIKRQIIGTAFIHVLKDVCDELKLDFDTTFIAQGTLRPDLIESGNPEVSGFAHKIKTHHNDVDIIRHAREKGMIIETNWDWHKDEVRQVARMLGLDESVASRQPFPGPGLGVRILCTGGGETITAEEEKRFDEYINNQNGIKGWLAPLRSVGVQGDCRSYRKMAVVAGDDMETLVKIASDMPNTLDFINRVTVMLDRKSLKNKITTTKTYINHENAELLRELDDIAVKALKTPGIAQCFAALLPICEEGAGKRSVVMRAVVTGDFMTAKAAGIGTDIDREKLMGAVTAIKEKFGDSIDMVLYDITGKPPATVEWE